MARYERDFGGMRPGGQGGRDARYDREMRGGRAEMDGYPDVRGYPPRFGQGRPLFAEAHGYDRDFGAPRGGWSNLSQHARGFIHGYDRDHRQPPLGGGRERGFGRDW
jgi:hypothetical protein